jgi:L-2-hydroxyglutarate oxidase LhgO
MLVDIYENIIVIGTGWYGCHITTILKQYPDKFTITMIDSKNDIFDNSSYYNQNRLHYGYHYSRMLLYFIYHVYI